MRKLKNTPVNILIVDDHPENLLAIEAVLSSPEYRLIKAHSGVEALKWVLREEFAVILMDVQMPILNGFDTVKMIREREKSKDVPIIFITALSQTVENVLYGYSVGAIDYIIKPFDPIILKCKVEGFVSLYESKKLILEQQEIINRMTKELLHKEIKEKNAAMKQLHQSREHLQKSEKLSVVGELAAGIAHEIRNPLTSLKGFTQLLYSKTTAESDYVEIMISEIDRINTIVSELLLLAKPSKDDFMNIPIEGILEDVCTLMSAQANLHGVMIQRDFMPELQFVYVNAVEDKLKQVFINIIKNAIEAMNNGGTITIQTRRLGDKVVVIFKDNGMGIPSDILEKLGKPFFTTKEKGTGLGLMVSISIIESHMGQLNIYSEEGVGTSVEVTLPIAKDGT